MTTEKRRLLSCLLVLLLLVGLFGITTVAAIGQGIASISVTLDGKAYNNREVTLRQEGEIRATLTPAGVGRYEGDELLDGTYDIFLDGVSTVRTIRIQDGAGSATVSLMTVRFYSDKDTVYSSSMVPLGQCVKKPMKNPEKKGSTFAEWVTAAWKSYDFDQPINGTLNLYATWTTDEQKVDIALDGVTVQGSTDIKDGGGCSVKLVPEEGKMLPQTLTATMDGKPFKNFTYDPATGELKIPAGAVTGALAFEGETVEVKQVKVTSSVQNCVLYGSLADTKNGYSGKLVPNAGYQLPDAIQVTAGGIPVTFSYQKGTGEITLAAGAVTGDIHIAGASSVGIQAGQYTVIASIGHGTATVISDSSLSVLEVKIQPDAGYNSPTNILVMVGSSIFTDYSYDPSSGVLQIGSGKVGQVMISASCSRVGAQPDQNLNTDESRQLVIEP